MRGQLLNHHTKAAGGNDWLLQFNLCNPLKHLKGDEAEQEGEGNGYVYQDDYDSHQVFTHPIFLLPQFYWDRVAFAQSL